MRRALPSAAGNKRSNHRSLFFTDSQRAATTTKRLQWPPASNMRGRSELPAGHPSPCANEEIELPSRGVIRCNMNAYIRGERSSVLSLGEEIGTAAPDNEHDAVEGSGFCCAHPKDSRRRPVRIDDFVRPHKPSRVWSGPACCGRSQRGGRSPARCVHASLEAGCCL